MSRCRDVAKGDVTEQQELRRVRHKQNSKNYAGGVKDYVVTKVTWGEFVIG
ncbi:MAG TPA: hypothetical protein VE994_08070 [Terriglobales bacterium]|nr:hypothetical protein [Terriglobales bacterium]